MGDFGLNESEMVVSSKKFFALDKRYVFDLTRYYAVLRNPRRRSRFSERM